MTLGPNTGPDAADIAAQMAAVTTPDQVATHPQWTGDAAGGAIGDVLEGPEGHAGVVQEADEAAEDRTEAAEEAPNVQALASGIIPGAGYFPNQAPPRLPGQIPPR